VREDGKWRVFKWKRILGVWWLNDPANKKGS
jgi:hypothetical protein